VLLCWSSPYRLLPFPAPLLRPWLPTGRGSSTARAERSKSSIATTCFAAGSSGCGRRAISLWRPASDRKNPDPAFRQRLLCGLTILQGLQPAGLDHWNSGSLYNPNDGVTYRVSAELRSADVFVARIYLGVPVFGETKTLLRVPAAQVGRMVLAPLTGAGGAVGSGTAIYGPGCLTRRLRPRSLSPGPS
jgi:hypothetical protein